MGTRETALKNLEKAQGRLTGRPKGSKNRFTNLKEVFLEAFEELGGTPELVNWAKQEKNRRDFYRMIAAMLPKNVNFDKKPEGKIYREPTDEEVDALIRYCGELKKERKREKGKVTH